jgi:hypothetical protein
LFRFRRVCFGLLATRVLNFLIRSADLFTLVKMAANLPNQAWCSKCSTFRDSESFETKKSGQKKKLCNRHERKRELQFDDWDAFEIQLNKWNRLVSYPFNWPF